MTRHESPGYYCVTDTPDERPDAEECAEGRLFVDADRLVCGAGKMGGLGYADTLDTYSESTVRRLFGNRFDPQAFDLGTALQRDATLVVPLSAIVGAELRQWEGARLRGAEHTFAVVVRAPSALEDPLLLQLGRGGRNRGTGRTRHASFARWLDALDGTTASDADAVATDTGTGASTSSPGGVADTPGDAGSAGTTDGDESVATDPEPSTPEPQAADAAPDTPQSGALADVARSEPVDTPAESGPETGDATADPAGLSSDAESPPSTSPTQDGADTRSDASTTPEPEAADTPADSGGRGSPDADEPVATDPEPGEDEATETVDSDGTETVDSDDATDEVADSDDGTAESAGSDDEPVDSGEPDSEAADPEPTWLDDEPDDPALIVKNRSNIRLRPRIRCRRGGEVLFLDDIDLAPGDTHRWTEFPEEGVVHLDILFDDGSRNAEQLDERHLRSPPVGIDLYASGVEVHAAE